MDKPYIYTITEDQAGERADVVASAIFSLSRSQIQKLMKRGFFFINDLAKDKPGTLLVVGDRIEIREKNSVSDVEIIEETKELVDIPIIKETDNYVVIYKPAGVLAHPTQAAEKGTVADWLRIRYPFISSVGDSPERPGIVHRLDKEASGLMVVAKTQPMFDCLKKQFQQRSMEKEYTVLVHGILPVEHGTIDFDMDRGKDGAMVSRPYSNPLSLKGIKTKQPGKEALTEFWVEKQFARFALLKVRIHTGRTHQIRVHFFAYNHPVVGDALYFNKKLNRKRDIELGRLFLHACRLTFTDLNGQSNTFEAPLPEALTHFLDTVK